MLVMSSYNRIFLEYGMIINNAGRIVQIVRFLFEDYEDFLRYVVLASYAEKRR